MSCGLANFRSFLPCARPDKTQKVNCQKRDSRGACASLDRGQPCVAFIAENLDGTPKYSDFESADVAWYICDHPGVAHVSENSNLTAQNGMFARGGTNDGRCAAFFSPAPAWNMRMIYVCGLPWAAHSVLALPATTTLVPQRLVIAFTGLEQRRVSIQRTLHRNEPSTLTSSHSTPPRKRKSGPPRPFSDTTATLDNFAPPTVVDWVTLTVGILPKVSGDDIENAQTALQRANLVSTVPVQTSSPIFEVVNAAFQHHCQAHNIDYVAPARSASTPVTPTSIKAPDDVITHLGFSQTHAENDLWGENNEIVALITRFVTHYLKLPGGCTNSSARFVHEAHP
ncbi:hypothetical protein B0H13DRAFT_2428488 [Mycena leptocephala]|nr:hypothetical protein B0H13DRAFT_2428488 [Mycena leptocephala]